MNTYAIVEIKGKQYKIFPGLEILVDKLVSNPGDKIDLDKILLYCDDGKVVVGTPYVSTKKIGALVVSAAKGPKLKIFRYKAKSRYQKETGFRSKLTQIRIDAFGSAPTESPKAATPVSTTAKKEVKTVKTAKQVKLVKPVRKNPAPKK